MSMNHLSELARVDVRGDRFVRRGDRIYLAQRYGKSEDQALSVVDVSAPAEPRVAATIPFRRSMQALSLVGELLYVFEYERAIHLVNLATSPPTVPDCYLMFRQQVYDFDRVGSRWLVAARNWQGISVFDVSRPGTPTETACIKLGESFVESIVVSGERVFAVAHGDGLVELRISDDGSLVEVGRWLGGEDGFNVHQAFVVGDRLWVFGEGTLPYAKDETEDEEAADEDSDDDFDEEYEEEEPEPNTVVFDLGDFSKPVWMGTCPIPKQVRALPDGGAISIVGYRCYRFPPLGKAELLFELHESRPDWDDKPDEPRRYLEINRTTDRDALPNQKGVMDDAACWTRRGQHLYIAHGSTLAVYTISRESPLAQMAED